MREADGAVSTGFLGTPLVLPALSRFGHFDEAYMMLLRTGVRSWLYQVANDATTRVGAMGRDQARRFDP